MVERKLGIFKEAVEHLRVACNQNLLPAACSELRELERSLTGRGPARE